MRTTVMQTRKSTSRKKRTTGLGRFLRAPHGVREVRGSSARPRLPLPDRSRAPNRRHQRGRAQLPLPQRARQRHGRQKRRRLREGRRDSRRRRQVRRIITKLHHLQRRGGRALARRRLLLGAGAGRLRREAVQGGSGRICVGRRVRVDLCSLMCSNSFLRQIEPYLCCIPGSNGLEPRCDAVPVSLRHIKNRESQCHISFC